MVCCHTTFRGFIIMNAIINILFPPFTHTRGSIGLLVLRLLMGIGIALHGWGKVGHIEAFSEAVGVPVFLGFLAVAAELGGGILLALGALTPMVSAALTGNMVVAVMMHMSKGDPFLLTPTGDGYTAGWEFAALYLVGFICILLMGPGKLSLDYLIFRKNVSKS